MTQSDKIFAVIDTNVLVSALLSRNGTSNPAIILNKIVSGDVIPIINQEILTEYRQVLYRPKFSILTSQEIENVINIFNNHGINVERKQVVNEIFPDPKDIVFYEVKMSVEDSYLVTGNIKHFPQKPFVVTPKEMVDIIEGNN